MGGCASKPKTITEKEATPLPVPVVEEKERTMAIPTLLEKEVKVENEEKKSDYQIDEKKVDEGEKKVEEDGQPLSLGCLLIQVIA